jgi:hypothetical protein
VRSKLGFSLYNVRVSIKQRNMNSTRIFTSTFVLIAVCLLAQASYSAVFTVTNTNDSGPGSLRQAVLDANVNNVEDTIVFDAAVFNVPRTIVLTTGEIVIQPDDASGTARIVTIIGPGANLLELNGNNNSRIFNVAFVAMLVVDGVKMSGGNGMSNGENPNFVANGGAVRSDQGFPGTIALTLRNCIVSNNSATFNGGRRRRRHGLRKRHDREYRDNKQHLFVRRRPVGHRNSQDV